MSFNVLSVSSVCQEKEFLDMKRINNNCYKIFYVIIRKKIIYFIFAGKIKITLLGKHVSEAGQR